MHGKPKSHLLRLLTPELHPVTDAAAHVVSGAGEICWSRRKCSVATQGVFFFFFFYLLFPQILDFEILIDLDNFLDTVSGVAGPLLILEKVKVGDFALLPYIS